MARDFDQAKHAANSGIARFNHIFIDLMRFVFQRLPLNESAVYAAKSFVYKRFGFFFQRSLSYRIWCNARSDADLNLEFNRFPVDIPKVDPDELLDFPKVQGPDVSVIIILFDPANSPLPILKSLKNDAGRGPTFDVLLIDALPEDADRTFFEKIRGVRVVDSGAVKTMAQWVEIGPSSTGGRYLAFLAGCLLPMPGWLSELHRIFTEQSDVGLVCPQIVFSNGLTETDGRFLDESGTACLYGSGVHPYHPDFSYTRKVDACPVLSFMVSRKAVSHIGISFRAGKDLIQAGGVLSGMIQMTGLHLFHNPLSKVLILSQLQENARTVSSYIGSIVRNNLNHTSRLSSAECRQIPRSGHILVLDLRTPTPDQDSGSQDLISYFKIFLGLGFEVTFIPVSDFKFMGKYTIDLQRLGVRCLYSPFVTGVKGHLKTHGKKYDLILINKVNCAADYIALIQRYCAGAKIVFNTVDLHFLREQRQARIEDSRKLQVQSAKTKSLELSVICKADCTIVLSAEEYERLQEEPEIRGDKIAVIPLIREIPGRSAPYSARRDILFLGGFEHSPNVDAMIYFVRDIWPLVKNILPEIVFYIVGSKPPADIMKLAAGDIIVTGYVPDLSTYLNRCRLSVAPLRYGAGLKGKVATSMGYGVPCVATSTALEGSGLEPGMDILVADDPDAFANAIAHLYQNEFLWNSLSENGLRFMRKNYSFDAGRRNIEHLLRHLGVLK